MRTAVNGNDQRVLGGVGHADGLRQEGFNFKLVIVADEGECFHLCDGLAGQEIVIQIGEPARSRAAGLQVQL